MTKIFGLLFMIIVLNSQNALASGGEASEEFNPGEVIMHHVKDDHIWHFFDGHYGTLHLPIILYTKSNGLEIFSSSNFYNEAHEEVAYNGYQKAHGHISLVDSEEHVWDFSITKNVAMLFINATLMILVFTAVARGYKKNKGKAPKGIQSFFEPIIVYIRDEVVKPNIGEKHTDRFMPYMLHLFFFIWFGNLLGLLPGAANMTGNIAVTAVLAVGTLVLTNVNGNKDYWKHIFWTPGVPTPLKLIIVPVEMIGAFLSKPISLAIRLFVAITAGHIVILSLISMAFIFHSWSVGLASSVVVLFINIIEILVATIQAYVFTMFSSLYIGMAVAEHDEHH